MIDTPPDPADGDGAAERRRTTAAGTPRWVKVGTIIALTLALLAVVLKLSGFGGGHGPGRHTPAAETARTHAGLPSRVTHTQP